MIDQEKCPICSAKLKTIVRNKKIKLRTSNVTSFYTEKTCVHSFNHSLQMFIDSISHKIELMKFSIEKDFSKFVELDFHNKRATLLCQGYEPIPIPFPDSLDFPSLSKFKEKINLCIILS